MTIYLEVMMYIVVQFPVLFLISS